MFEGARRSSPGIEELRYPWGRGFREDEDWMLPVNGARSELDCIGSSRSLMFASSTVIRNTYQPQVGERYRHLDL